MKQYLELVQDILQNGEVRDDRTGVGTRSVFSRQIRFDLAAGFPAITTKKLAWKAVVGELLWFLEGSSDERRLAEITHGSRDGATTIWTPNSLAPYWKEKAKYPGDLGRIYGVQWRNWQGKVSAYAETNNRSDNQPNVEVTITREIIDQIQELVKSLRTDPYSRRHVLTAWNPADLNDMALPPCHILSQFYVSKSKLLSCHMYQRSQDVYLGAPFNYASYALLTHMLAQITGLGVGELVVSTGDTHLYNNHIDQATELLQREPMKLPTLWLNPDVTSITKFTMDDIKLLNYESHGQLKAPMAV